MSDEDRRWVTLDPKNPEHRGQIDRARFDNPLPDDPNDPDDQYPEIDDATVAATLAELAELRRRRTPKRA